jgi:hypothetical protein
MGWAWLNYMGWAHPDRAKIQPKDIGSRQAQEENGSQPAQTELGRGQPKNTLGQYWAKRWIVLYII